MAEVPSEFRKLFPGLHPATTTLAELLAYAQAQDDALAALLPDPGLKNEGEQS